jgi:hypothetical protein
MLVEFDDPPPEGWTVIDSLVLSRCLDEEGNPEFWISAPPHRPLYDLLGDLRYATLRVERMCADEYTWVEEWEDE